jgi:ComF family protein
MSAVSASWPPAVGGVAGLGSRLSRLADAALSLLFPARCVGCGEFETYLCPACRRGMRVLTEPWCPRCGRPGVSVASGAFCLDCVDRDLDFVRARSAFVYEGAAQGLVTSLKFQGMKILGDVMAGLAAPAFLALVAPLDAPVVTWGPSHSSVQRRRGYNQAEVLAKALARGAGGLPVQPLARKAADTRHQLALGREERQRNLVGAFVAHSSPPMGMDAVVLVDDVYTTGATAGVVAATLREATGLPVHVFTFARALGPVDGQHD